jgi:hypothetical protein
MYKLCVYAVTPLYLISYTMALNSTTAVGLGCPWGQESGSPLGLKV